MKFTTDNGVRSSATAVLPCRRQQRGALGVISFSSDKGNGTARWYAPLRSAMQQQLAVDVGGKSPPSHTAAKVRRCYVAENGTRHTAEAHRRAASPPLNQSASSRREEQREGRHQASAALRSKAAAATAPTRRRRWSVTPPLLLLCSRPLGEGEDALSPRRSASLLLSRSTVGHDPTLLRRCNAGDGERQAATRPRITASSATLHPSGRELLAGVEDTYKAVGCSRISKPCREARIVTDWPIELWAYIDATALDGHPNGMRMAEESGQSEVTDHATGKLAAVVGGLIYNIELEEVQGKIAKMATAREFVYVQELGNTLDGMHACKLNNTLA
nr:hypothetical protein Iba_chr14aCG5520 [Ipomoea batatas]